MNGVDYFSELGGPLVRLARTALILLALWAGGAGLAQAQTFTVLPASGPGPFTVTLDVPNGTNCQAAGIADWSGAVAASLTKQVSPAVGAKTLTVVCTVPGAPQKGSATITWVPATLNVDATPYTNAKDVLIIGEKRTPPTAQIVALPVGTNRYVATDLDAGKWYFAAKSRNSTDVTSDLSGIVSKDVVDTPTTTTFSGSATINVTAPPVPPKPKAPVLSIE